MNQSKISNFNPHRSSNHKSVYGSLIDFLNGVSEKFKNNFQEAIANTKVTEAMKYHFQSMDKIRKVKWLDSLEMEHTWNSRKNFIDSHVKVDLLSLKDWN